jgi:hypothetical protein
MILMCLRPGHLVRDWADDDITVFLSKTKILIEQRSIGAQLRADKRSSVTGITTERPLRGVER